MQSHPSKPDSSQKFYDGPASLCTEFEQKLNISDGEQTIDNSSVHGNNETGHRHTEVTNNLNNVQNIIKKCSCIQSTTSNKDFSITSKILVLPNKKTVDMFQRQEKGNERKSRHGSTSDKSSNTNQQKERRRSFSLHRQKSSDMKCHSRDIDIQNEESYTLRNKIKPHQRRFSDSRSRATIYCDINFPDVKTTGDYKSHHEESSSDSKLNMEELGTVEKVAKVSKDMGTLGIKKSEQMLEGLSVKSKQDNTEQVSGPHYAEVHSEDSQCMRDNENTDMGTNNQTSGMHHPRNEDEGFIDTENRNSESKECRTATSDESYKKMPENRMNSGYSTDCGANQINGSSVDDHKVKTTEAYLVDKNTVEETNAELKQTVNMEIMHKNHLDPLNKTDISSPPMSTEDHILQINEMIQCLRIEETVEVFEVVYNIYKGTSDFQEKSEEYKQIDSNSESQADSSLKVTAPSNSTIQTRKTQPDQSQSQQNASLAHEIPRDGQLESGNIGSNKTKLVSTVKESIPKCECGFVNNKEKITKCVHCGKEQVPRENGDLTSNGASVVSDLPGNSTNEQTSNHENKIIEKKLKLPRITISNNKHQCKEEKVLLLLGASGSGKSTLIKLIASFYAGLMSPNEYLLKDTRSKMESLVNQNCVTAYTAYPDDPEGVAITVIDTPGLNDSSGEVIEGHIDDLQGFLADANSLGLDIHAVGFVVQAHVSRLTASEELVMKYVSRHFKKASSHMIPFITFADSQKTPPVINALKEFKVNVENFFLFNNSVLSLDDVEEVNDIDKTYWKKGYRNWKNIYNLISTFSPLQVLNINNKADPRGQTTLSHKNSDGQKSTTEGTTQTTNMSDSVCRYCKSVIQSTESSVTKLESPGKRDISTNTENMMQKKFTKHDMIKNENECLHEVQEDTVKFVISVDNDSQQEWRVLREKIWKNAQKTYQTFGLNVTCDIWLYSLTKEISNEIKPTRFDYVHYCSILAMCKSKPLVNVGHRIVQASKATHEDMKRHLSSWYYPKYKVHLLGIVTYNAVIAIANALVEHEVKDFMDTRSFLNYLMQEVSPDLWYFIDNELLKSENIWKN